MTKIVDIPKEKSLFLQALQICCRYQLSYIESANNCTITKMGNKIKTFGNLDLK